jgi:hypothetical protein
MNQEVKRIYCRLLDTKFGKIKRIDCLSHDWIGLIFEDDSCHAIRPFVTESGDRIQLATKKRSTGVL